MVRSGVHAMPRGVCSSDSHTLGDDSHNVSIERHRSTDVPADGVLTGQDRCGIILSAGWLAGLLDVPCVRATGGVWVPVCPEAAVPCRVAARALDIWDDAACAAWNAVAPSRCFESRLKRLAGSSPMCFRSVYAPCCGGDAATLWTVAHT